MRERGVVSGRHVAGLPVESHQVAHETKANVKTSGKCSLRPFAPPVGFQDLDANIQRIGFHVQSIGRICNNFGLQYFCDEIAL